MSAPAHAGMEKMGHLRLPCPGKCLWESYHGKDGIQTCAHLWTIESQ